MGTRVRERNQNRLLAELFMQSRRGTLQTETRVFFHEIPKSHGMQNVEATLSVNGGEPVLLESHGILYPASPGWQFVWGGPETDYCNPQPMHHYGPFESAEHAQGAMLEHIEWEAYALTFDAQEV